jgi:hypothetical protein
VEIQELISNGGQKPDKKLFVNAGGQVVKHCADVDGDGRLEMQLFFDGQVLESALVDTDANGVVDQREVYQNGQQVRLDADTNADRKPDVIRHFRDGQMTRQDEDSNYDGLIDRSFEGRRKVALPAERRVPDPFDDLGCGDFHSFWAKR